MATIKYRLHSRRQNAPIYLKLSISREQRFERKTGLVTNPNDWSTSTSLPKQNNPINKNLTSKLRGLSHHLQNVLNNALSEGVEVDGKWLEFQIDLYFKRTNERGQSEYLLDAIQTIIDTANIRKNSSGGLGLSKARVNSYHQLKKRIEDFDNGTRTKIKQVDRNYGQRFLSYLLDECKYSKSYSLKKVDDLKTVCYNAELNGIETSRQIKSIEGGKVKNEYVIYLTPQDLEKIENLQILNTSLDNVRKWLLLGCHIGQRGNDLLGITYNNFVTRDGLEMIELIQQKTKKAVAIPVLPETKIILDDGLPYKISLQKFNVKVKEVCKDAGVDYLVQGNKRDKETNRNVVGEYPKYELIGSHVCRRTFATNNYGILPTPLIMQITMHSTEKMLLQYIGKNGYDYAKQIAEFYELQRLKQQKQPQLNVVRKKVSND